MSSTEVTQMHGAGPTDRECQLEVGAREVKAWARRQVQNDKPVNPQVIMDILAVYFPEERPA